MATATIHVSLDEFLRNAPDFFARVVHEQERVVVENAAGETVEVRPTQPKRSRSLRLRPLSQADYEAFLSSFGGWHDIDVDDLMKKIYESRDLPPRPQVTL